MNQNFRKKILSMMIVSYIMVLTMIIVATYFTQNQNLKHSLNSEIKILLDNFEKQIAIDAEMLTKTLIGLERLDHIIDLHAQGNREELYKQAKPIFDNLKAEQITHWYFFNNDGINLLRVHKPEQFGDKPNRVSLQESINSNKLSIKLEMGKNFFSLRAVKPIFLKGQKVGYMEIGQEIDHIFSRMEKMTGKHTSVFLDNNYLQKINASVKNETIQNFTLLNSNEKNVALELAKSIELAKSLNAVQILFQDNYAIGLSPFKDGAGNIAGVAMIHMDISSIKKEMTQEAFIAISIYTVTLILGLIFFTRTVDGILKRLGGDPKYAIQVTQQIASGDLAVQIQYERDGSQNVLASLSQMKSNLNQMIQQISQNATNLTTQANQLERIAQDAERSSSQQQHSVGTIYQNVEDIIQKIQNVNEIASHASELTKHSGDLATYSQKEIESATIEIAKVARTVEESTAVIEHLGEESIKIKNATATIDDIAEQTNMLALNAAIEAARAGESGRGFAIVADEVRKLAERTASATQNITSIIVKINDMTQNAVSQMNDGVIQVNDGVKLVAHTKEIICQIQSEFMQVNHLIQDISVSLNEQSQSGDEIKNHIQSINHIAQQNAQVVVQTLNMAQQLKQLAGHLESTIHKFKV